MNHELPVIKPEDYDPETVSDFPVHDLDEEGFLEIKARIWARIIDELGLC